MNRKFVMVAALAGAIVAPAQAQAQQAERAVLVQLDSGVESGFFTSSDEARRELAVKVEMAARMACADAWTPRTTIYESIDYQIDWSAADRAHPRQRKAIARDISVKCRLW